MVKDNLEKVSSKSVMCLRMKITEKSSELKIYNQI